MQKPAPPMGSTLSLDQLRERFPRTAERFRASRYWSPLREESISRDLEQFFDVECSHVIHLEGVTEHGKVIGYWPKLTVHYKPAYFGKDWFQNKEDARLFILDLAAYIFEVELRITAA